MMMMQLNKRPNNRSMRLATPAVWSVMCCG